MVTCKFQQNMISNLFSHNIQNFSKLTPLSKMKPSFHLAQTEELMQILEIILEQDEIRMRWLLLRETSRTLHFKKDFTESFETNKG